MILNELSATEAAAAIRARQLSALDVVEAALNRIEILDDRLGAFMTVRGDAAREEAAQLMTRRDLADLPLAGVPVAVKDTIHVAGEPTRYGTAASSPRPAERDDESVLRLRAAGAIVVGKTRTPELAAWSFTESTAFGVTRNPWCSHLGPGGSSGGTAVAVATGMSTIGIGSDGGGSLRIPAAYCGVVGLKPTAGTVPAGPDALGDWCGLTAIGPITRSVGDAALTLAVLSAGGVPSWNQIGSPQPGPLRVAVSLRSPNVLAPPDAPFVATVRHVAKALEDAGHIVTERDPPYGWLLSARWSRRWRAGVADDASRLPCPHALEARTRTVVSKGRRIRRLGGPRSGGIGRWQLRLAAWFADVDVLLTPTVAAPPLPAGQAMGLGLASTVRRFGAATPYTEAWNLAGYPAASVPAGLGPDRMPMSVQVVAQPNREDLLIDASLAIEALMPQISLPPPATVIGGDS